MFSTVALLALCAVQIAGYNTNDQVGADIPYGTFQDPSAHVRPRFRYWIPDASVDLDGVANDFAEVAAKGLGGLELLGYYLYGDFPSVITEGGPVPTDWTKSGWGTEAWVNLTSVALQAAKEQGLVMDFALGPNQGAGVPAQYNDDGIMWNLWPFNISVPVGGTFSGTLPGWGTGELISASTGLVLQSEFVNLTASPAWKGPYYYNGTKLTLAASSLQDITAQVEENGRVELSFPADTVGLEYQVFAYYQNHSEYLEQQTPLYLNTTVPQSPVKTFVENGSHVVDHFSAAGAQLVIDFWEQYLLDNGTRDLIKEVGNYGWEDSQEFSAGVLVWWTPAILNAFQSARGYSLREYLPLIYHPNTGPNGPLASHDWYQTDEPDQGQMHINDYRQTLTELNRKYLETLANWAMVSLESQFSAQVVYNLPMDMLANVPAVNAPECESLGFDHNIDAYRQFSGPANLAGKRIVSSELGAQRNEVYSQTLPELIWDVKRSIVGSVNQFVFHGYPYSGSYPNTSWPGFTTFTYRFSNMHGPRQPTWEYYSDYMNWTARTQYIAQSGVPKIDLAFWLKINDFSEVPSQYSPNDLQSAGFTYEYLSPDNFELPEAYIQDGVLAPARQAFKALIIRGNDTLTVSGVQTLVAWAHSGLPVVVSGGIPQNLSSYNTSGTAYVRTALAGLVSEDLPNVHMVPYDNLAASLNAIGIAPRTRISADAIWYTYWREELDSSASYVFVYNDAWDYELGEGASTGSITFEATGVPYTYDAWTGEINPILAYQQTNTSITIPLHLAGNQSTLIAFHHNETAASEPRVVSMPENVYKVSVSGSYGRRQLAAKAGNNTSGQPILFSNGSTLDTPTPAAAMNLSRWALTVESWSPPADLYADQTKPALSNSTYNITGLKPWSAISDSLRNVSGRGYYSTTIHWPPSNGTADGAMIDLGAIINTARVWVNGHQLPPLDPTHAIADIGECLVQGENKVEIVVATTLGNVLAPIWDEIRSSGTLAQVGPVPIKQEYGLVQDVMILPYRSVTVDI